MSWNYRIFRTKYRQTLDNDTEEHFSLREAYYGEDGVTITMISAQPVSFSEETFEELRDTIFTQVARAFREPVITPKDLPWYNYGTNEIPLY